MTDALVTRIQAAARGRAGRRRYAGASGGMLHRRRVGAEWGLVSVKRLKVCWTNMELRMLADQAAGAERFWKQEARR